MNISPWALIQARRNRGLTRRQAAEALGVSPATLLDWEKGVRQPRPGRLVDLAGCYGCHIDDLSARADGQARMSEEGKGADALDSLGHAARAPAAGAEADKSAEPKRSAPPGAGRATYRQAALALDPAAYDLELPARIAGCPDFYFPEAPRNPAGCGALDKHCVACWDRPYQGETARNGLKKEDLG